MLSAMTTLLDKTTKSGLVTLILGLSLLIPASIGLLLAGAPSVISSIPMLTAIPAISLFGGAAVLIPTLFFFVWNPGLFRGEENVPKRSYGLLASNCDGVQHHLVCWRRLEIRITVSRLPIHASGLRYKLRLGCITLDDGRS